SPPRPRRTGSGGSPRRSRRDKRQKGEVMSDNLLPRPDLGTSQPLVTPLYQSSVYTLPDLDALDGILDAQQPGYIYARDAHPNARLLAARLAQLEEASWALVTSSG